MYGSPKQSCMHLSFVPFLKNILYILQLFFPCIYTSLINYYSYKFLNN
jgi:hypothetical protein